MPSSSLSGIPEWSDSESLSPAGASDFSARIGDSYATKSPTRQPEKGAARRALGDHRQAARARWWLWLALALPGWCAPPAAYLQRLERADAALAQAQRAPAQAPALLQDARELADLCPELRAALASPTAQTLAHAREALAVFRRAAASAPAPGATSNAHAMLQSVLSADEFRSLADQPAVTRATPSWWKSITHAWHEFWRSVGQLGRRLLNWIIERLPQGDGNAKPQPSWWEPLRLVLWIVLLLALLVGGGFLYSHWLLRRQQCLAGEESADTEEEAITQGRLPAATSWERALRDAEAQWERGETREALRTVLRACLLLLDARGLLRYEASRANGEVLRALRARGASEVLTVFTPVVRSFERGWYGFLPVEQEEFSRMLEQSRRLRALIARES